MSQLAAMTPNTALARLMDDAAMPTTSQQQYVQPRFDVRKRLQLLKPEEDDAAPARVAESHEEGGSPPKVVVVVL